MKKLIIAIIAVAAFLISARPALAQEKKGDKSAPKTTDNNSTIFEINPVGYDRIYPEVKFRSFYKFRITNVNAIKLSGYATATPVNFESTVPAIFADTKMPEMPGGSKTEKLIEPPANALTGAKAKPSKKNKSGASEEQLAEAKNQLKDTFVKYYTDFTQNYRSLQLYTVAEDSLYKMLPDIIVPDTEGLRDNCKNYMLSIYGLDDETKFEKMLKATFADLNKNYLSLKQVYEALNGTGITNASNVTGVLKDKAESVVITVSKASAALTYDPLFLDQYTAATKIYNELNKGDAQAKIFNKAYKGISLFRRITKQNAFETYTKVYQITADEDIVTPALKNEKGAVVQEFNPVSIKAYGGGKVDFSTGYLLTFRGNDNYSYYYADGKIKGVARQSRNSLTNSIGALAHWYRRNANSASAALSGGFSLTTDGDIGFYLGASGLLLEKNRLALTAGLSFVKVKILNTANLDSVTGTDKYSFNATETTINYDTLYKPGFFVGITYNIFKTSDKTTPK